MSIGRGLEKLVERCEATGNDFMFYTYSAHPLGCAIADRVLEIMERERLVERADELGAVLGERLQQTLGNHPAVGDIRGAGLFWGIEVVTDRESKRPFPAGARATNRVLAAAMRRGLYVYPSTGMAGEAAGDAVMVAPPFVIGEPEIDFIATTLKSALDEVTPNLPRS